MSEALIDRFLGSVISKGILTVVMPSGKTHTIGAQADGFPNIRVRLADNKVARDLLLDPRLGAGEAYMDGRLIIEHGDIMQLVQLLRANKPWERGGRLKSPSLISNIKNRAKFLKSSFNEATSSKRNVAHHYDIGNDLYELMLDPEHMQYSCAYWADGTDNLGQAQRAKLAHIAAKLAISDGHRILDIGCGWGGMAIFLASHYDCHVTGITLSEEQLALAQQRAKQAGVEDRVSFQLIDYRDLAKQGETFDRIVSVGMFEHVGRPQFDAFFQATGSLLSDDGVMLLHTIGRFGGPGVTDAFTSKYIFPGGYIPALSETLSSSEKYRLIHSDVETLRLHYAKTLRTWYAKCEEHRDQIIQLFDERFYRMWTFYLAGATAAFESGGMGNYQIQFTRNRNALPLTRDYIAAEEKRLLNL